MYTNKAKHNQFKSYSSASVPQKPKQPEMNDMNAFPELGQIKPVSIVEKPVHLVDVSNSSFVNKVKWVVEEEKIEETWYGKLGMTLLVPGNKKVKPVVYETTYLPPALVPAPGTRPAEPPEIMKALAEKYDKWKAEYIRDYGIDDYENTFRFPGYDYEYFDKLDEAWDLELQELQELEAEKEREQNEEFDYDELYTSKDYN
jgi:hypothetical protein